MVKNGYGRTVFSPWRNRLPHRYGTRPDLLEYSTSSGSRPSGRPGNCGTQWSSPERPPTARPRNSGPTRTGSAGVEADRIVLHELIHPLAAVPTRGVPVPLPLS